jgi:hypothetical protein
MGNEKKFDMPGSVSIVSTGIKQVVKEKFESVVDSIEQQSFTGNTLEDIYDRFSKLIYLIDASGSMGDWMAKDEPTSTDYNWTDEILRDAKVLLLEAIDDGADILDPDSGVDLTAAAVKKLTPDQLKAVVLQEGLEAELNLQPINVAPATQQKRKSKMMAVKDAARDFVKKRFEKWPDANVMLFSFESHPTLLAAGISEQNVLDGINRLPDGGGGGTDIYRAVARAVEHCKKRKDDVGVHHIVLVSDGMDGGATGVRGLLPDMKEIGIVFDFIFIQGGSENMEGDPIIRALREVCEATGGEFTIVKSEKDFLQKFLAASNRLCLPPAPKHLK